MFLYLASIYRIFRASQNTNRWRIINQMFAKFLSLDARVKKISLGGAFSLSLAGASATVRTLRRREAEKGEGSISPLYRSLPF